MSEYNYFMADSCADCTAKMIGINELVKKNNEFKEQLDNQKIFTEEWMQRALKAEDNLKKLRLDSIAQETDELKEQLDKEKKWNIVFAQKLIENHKQIRRLKDGLKAISEYVHTLEAGAVTSSDLITQTAQKLMEAMAECDWLRKQINSKDAANNERLRKSVTDI